LAPTLAKNVRKISADDAIRSGMVSDLGRLSMVSVDLKMFVIASEINKLRSFQRLQGRVRVRINPANFASTSIN
jgi:hypothetical protein